METILGNLIIQAYRDKKLYPNMSNSELHSALRSVCGNDETFYNTFSGSSKTFRKYQLEPAADALRERGITFDFSQASRVWLWVIPAATVAPTPEPEHSEQEEDSASDWSPAPMRVIARTEHQDVRAPYADFHMPMRVKHYGNGYLLVKRSSGFDPDAKSQYGAMMGRFGSAIGCDLRKRRWVGHGFIFHPAHGFSDDELYRQLSEASIAANLDIDITAQYAYGENYDAVAVELQ